MAKATLSIVIPVYRGEAALPELIAQLAGVLPEISTAYEVILVNDGSPDGSWKVIQALSEKYPWLVGIDLMRNYGQHNALLCGIRRAQHELIVTMDDDLQHPPAEIGKLLAKLEEGFDVVYGVPAEMKHSFVRNLLSRTIKGAIAKGLGLSNVRDLNAFRAFRTPLRRSFADYHSPNLLLDALLTWGTTRFAAVVVRHEARRYGQSGYNFMRLFNQTLFMLTGFSTAPLRLASYIGFGFTAFGVAVFLYVLGISLIVGSVPGFPFLASLIAIFSGAQLFSLGIMGEYLARMFNRSLERPPYVVAQVLEQHNGAPTHPST